MGLWDRWRSVSVGFGGPLSCLSLEKHPGLSGNLGGNCKSMGSIREVEG